MPPKKGDKGAAPQKGDAEKPKKLTKAEQASLALSEAVNGAQRRFKQHEKQRVVIETYDRDLRGASLIDELDEKERLAQEMQAMQVLERECEAGEALALAERTKHQRWRTVSEASRLPSVDRESDINAFLSVWRDEEGELERWNPSTTVRMSTAARTGVMVAAAGKREGVLFLPGEQYVKPQTQRGKVDEELAQCADAQRLVENILWARDAAVVAKQAGKIAAYDRCLEKVYAQLRYALDVATRMTLRFYDTILDNQEDEMLIRLVRESGEGPRGEQHDISSPGAAPTATGSLGPSLATVNLSASKSALTESAAAAGALASKAFAIKYGLWIKIHEATRSFSSFTFKEIDISLDPKDNNVHRLPQALGLSKENVAIRVMQLSFNPYSVITDVALGEEYYVMDCVLYVDVLNFPERPKASGKWLLRNWTTDLQELGIVRYPPITAEAGSEDLGLRISFEVPPHVVRRQPTILIGKWTEKTSRWEPCSHCTFRAVLSDRGTARPANPRRCTFVTAELKTFALLQEKGFDVPYEQWQLQPIAADQVLYVVECRRRGEASDREVRILVQDGECRLIAPDDPELAPLRVSWFPPATLLRHLARAGINFVLKDADAVYIDGIVPKSQALEERAYRELAGICSCYAVSSSRHNKFGEDPSMALFRISRTCREPQSEEPLFVRAEADDQWYSIRYRTNHCVEAAFSEASERVNLSKVPGAVTHYNLHSLLGNIHGNQRVQSQATSVNFLLRRAILELLSLTRPLSWG